MQVFLLLGAGSESRQAVEVTLRQMYPWSEYLCETYYWFLRNIMLHDEQCYRLDLQKSISRNRVLTSWMTLHQMAVKLSKHLPEFTLQDPNADLFSQWEAAFEYSDSSSGEVEEETPAHDAKKYPALDPLKFGDILDGDLAIQAEALGCSSARVKSIFGMAMFWMRRTKLRIALRDLQVSPSPLAAA